MTADVSLCGVILGREASSKSSAEHKAKDT